MMSQMRITEILTTMIYAAIKLSENTKKALIILFLIFIILFVLIGYISLAVEGVMKKQGTKADEMLSDVVRAEYFDKEKPFRKFAWKKNMKVFYYEARIPFLILLGAWFTYVLFCLFTGKWGYNPLNRVDGFGTLLFEFGEWPKEKFFGITLISGWPEIVGKPHFVPLAIFSYIFVPANIVGIGWFLFCTQAYIARVIRIRKIARGIYRKKLVQDEPTPLAPTDNNSI